MNKQVFFSVIIPTHNRVDLLPKAIDSILGQTFQDFEIIIINDASTDSTKDYLNALKNDRIIVEHNESNLYKGATRNKGLDLANGQYIAFLDDDDYYLEHHLKTYYDEIVKQDFSEGLYFTMPFNENSKTGERTTRILPEVTGHPSAYLFNHRHAVATPKGVVSVTAAKKVRFDPRIKFGQDTEFFMRVALDYPIFRIPKHTVLLVQHDSNSAVSESDPGKKRMDGYKYIFANPRLRKAIPWTLKRKMYAYCYWVSANYFEKKGNRKLLFKSLVKSILHAPFYNQTPSNLIRLAYFVTDLIGITKKYKSK